MLPQSRSLLLWALIVSALVLIAAGMLTHASMDLLAQARAQTGRSKDVQLALQRTVATLLDAETGQRGYLLTGNEHYRAPYQDAVTTIRARLEHLGSLTAGDAERGGFGDRHARQAL